MDTVMKFIIYLTFALLLSPALVRDLKADEPYLGDPFQPAKSGCEIVWGKEVSDLPDTVPHFSAGDHRFDEKTIQYFKELGHFTPESRIPSLEHWETRKDTEIYENKKNHLNISPVTGSMIYRSQQNGSDRSLVEAPSVEEAKEKAKKLLQELGIDEALVSFNHVRFTTETSTWYDRAAQKPMSRRVVGGLFIPRLYESGPSSNSGVTVEYGLEGKLVKFSICWRDVQLNGRRKVPTREEIAKQILEGHATVMMDSAQNANKLTVKKISVIYREAEPFKKADTVEPYLLVKADAEASGVTADCTIYLKLN